MAILVRYCVCLAGFHRDVNAAAYSSTDSGLTIGFDMAVKSDTNDFWSRGKFYSASFLD